MKRTYPGEFEKIVLLTVAVLGQSAYGVAITDELNRQTGRAATGRAVSISAVHAALHCLEKKGMLSSHIGDAAAKRGGRRNQFFSVTTLGNRTLQEVREQRNRLWNSIAPQSLPAFGIVM